MHWGAHHYSEQLGASQTPSKGSGYALPAADMRSSSLALRPGGGPAKAPSVSIPSPIARLLGDDESGQIQQSNSIVMNAKFQGHRSGLAEPYFASRSKGRKVETGEMAQLKNKAAAMSRDFQNLLMAHERQETSVMDLRHKVRVLRGELEARDKAVDLARRTVERLAAEKGQLEAAAAGTQAYVRKLEARLLAAKSAVELEQHCGTLKELLDQQAAELHSAEARAEAAEAAAERARLDTTCLQRGLELAAEQLTRASGAEIPGTLLRAVARGQEEAVALGRQLADAKQQVSQLTEALERAREHMEQQQEALTQQRAEGGALRRRAEEAEAELERQAAATEELRRVLDVLKPKAGALAEERHGLLQQLEAERTAAADARREVDQLRAALRHRSTVERALRDELRRALAGVGCTPSPEAARQQSQPPPLSAALGLRRTTPGTGQRASGGSTAATGSRTLSRIGSAGQQRLVLQRQQQSGRPAAATQAGRRAGSPASAGGPPANKAVAVRQASAWEQQQGGEQEAGPSSGRAGSASPPLQQQQHQHQLSLLLSAAAGVQGQQYQQQQQHLEVSAPAAWPQHEPSWPHDLQLLPAEQRPPASTAAPAAADAEHQRTPPRQAAAGRPPLPPPQVQAQQQQRARQRRFVSALDQQIAQLECDIAQLTNAASPIAHLQQRTAAGALLGSSGGQAAAEQAAAAPGAAPPPPKKQEVAAEQGGIAAWRPNGAFDEAGHAAAPGAAGAAQLQPASAQQAARDGQQDGDDPVPNLWHCNPLAGSPAKLPLVAAPAAAMQRAHSADGATTVRPLLSPEADHAASAGTAPPHMPAGSQENEQPLSLRQQYGATSPGKHPAGGEAGLQQGRMQLPASTGPAPAIELQPRPQGSWGGSSGIRAPSITNQWELPSPGSATSDWLSNEQRHANIEQLEVTSTQTPLRGQQLQLEHPLSGGSAAYSAGAAEAEQQPAPLRRETPLLPGLPLQSHSLLPPHMQAVVAVADQQLPPAQQQKQQQHTLFDLAGMDMHDLLAGC